MKIATNPPRVVPLKDFASFQAAAKNDLFHTPQVIVVESSRDYQDLTRRLQTQVRPFAVALLTPAT
jgi:hypothetical protein